MLAMPPALWALKPNDVRPEDGLSEMFETCMWAPPAAAAWAWECSHESSPEALWPPMIRSDVFVVDASLMTAEGETPGGNGVTADFCVIPVCATLSCSPLRITIIATQIRLDTVHERLHRFSLSLLLGGVLGSLELTDINFDVAEKFIGLKSPLLIPNVFGISGKSLDVK
ncbi:hypothetical protein HG531_004132 [Fusarium graminearum]|nr:hypothetical protein HG531_004132 [Fusarium graminearum]